MANFVIDLSEFQTNVNFQKVKEAGVAGIILRCGYSGWGTGKRKMKDEEFENHYYAAQNAGIPVGAYYYSTAVNRAEAREEADFVLQLLKGKQFAYPIYLDTEDDHHQINLSAKDLTETAKAFLERVEGAGYYVGIYSYQYWLETKLQMRELAAYDVWVASYSDSINYEGPYGMWQYTSIGKVDGIAGSVDLNWAYQDYPQIIREAGLNGFGRKTPNQIMVYQSWLISRYHFSLQTDGIWGPITQEASIRALQTENGVPADGIWGPQTKRTCPNIAYGQENPYVWIVQGLLQKFPSIGSLAADGIFGPITQNRVEAFQSYAGVSVDGIVGPNTFEALIAN